MHDAPFRWGGGVMGMPTEPPCALHKQGNGHVTCDFKSFQSLLEPSDTREACPCKHACCSDLVVTVSYATGACH